MRLGALIVSLACATAHAETVVELPKTTARLELPDGWQTRPAPGIVAGYSDARGALLAVTRSDVPNPDAWKSETKQAYADEVERGIRSRIPGYKRLRKKLATVAGVPALDVEAKRDGGATVIMRVLLFRTYALSLAIEVPKGADVAGARAIAASFEPPKSADSGLESRRLRHNSFRLRLGAGPGP